MVCFWFGRRVPPVCPAVVLRSVLLVKRKLSVVRYVHESVVVGGLRIAVQVPSKNKDAAPDYIPIVCWRERAEFCGRYLSKGRQIVVEGRISTRKWKDEKT